MAEESGRASNDWQTKYEGMTRLYQKLRTEHLAALDRIQKLEKQAGSDS